MDRPAWAPPELDLTRPSPARVYDFYLGGFHNFAVDREMAGAALELWPELPQIMRANRAFLRRAVTYLAGAGIRQFLDIGSGIPTVDNVHSVAQEVAPDARVVYVDVDPVAVAHSRAILDGDPRTAVVQGDVRDPERVLTDPALTGLLDLDQPVALLLVALLHFVPDADEPEDVVRRYRDALAPGSYLVVSHASHDGRPEKSGSHQGLYRRAGSPMTMRSRDQVLGLFDGFDLVDPGVVYLTQWRPDGEAAVDVPEAAPGWVGVGRLS
jgi:SAM-dependent methyltransferase